ncbi:hypothetical protein HRW23_34940 [Streptomyces lunaelactis]|uniref:hypothetical protein n=1 Tax=Streptomyces lunaelactis TaxID=1535768 RepID=UPI001584AA21|nr:hypothetical protein [Streptomyces lunaelactis]NUK12344.1 hypothetical protein [Streptomyces lunaelactis]NUK35317.1 hypothetical protein [Streptomyces lunaelactis]NUK40956.1 hypothetical protein [Streptomyces lunaelactis]NUK59856.1 hypothetical protein [Streptomyces lunaelactis]NUK71020.1 hypothetical protein [Streptomyces lunaelactis]
MTLPREVQLNAWTGKEAAHGELEAEAAKWGAREDGLPHSQKVLPFEPPVPLTAWDDPDVGYGILLPDDETLGLTAAQKAAGEDAPAPVRELLAAREGSVVLRWSPDLGSRFLRRYYADDPDAQDSAIGLSNFGVGKGRLPKYVAIVGGPEVIPWSVQYALGTRHAVGRIPLEGEALAHYIDALLTDWQGAEATLDRALVWSVDHGLADIMTSLMRAVVAQPLANSLTPPPLASFREIAAEEATGAALLKELEVSRPGLVITSSHGLTEPLDDSDVMRASLGLPVDQTFTPVPVRELSAAMPGGCIWFAQACCSAGGAGRSLYENLLKPEWPAFGMVTAVARLGPLVAPAALAVLGRKNPVRAVLGHVEPTFSWTLEVEETGQHLGGRIVSALTRQLYSGYPLAYAFSDYRADVGQLHTNWFALSDTLAGGDSSVREEMTRLRLSAIDRQSLVLLGDPTVALPALPGFR